MDELNKNYVTEGQAAARQASTALTAAYRQLSASIEAEQTELSRFAQEQASAVNAVFGATSTIVSSVRNQLLAAKKQVINLFLPTVQHVPSRYALSAIIPPCCSFQPCRLMLLS